MAQMAKSGECGRIWLSRSRAKKELMFGHALGLLSSGPIKVLAWNVIERQKDYYYPVYASLRASLKRKKRNRIPWSYYQTRSLLHLGMGLLSNLGIRLIGEFS
jgi:hypothetical protein